MELKANRELILTAVKHDDGGTFEYSDQHLKARGEYDLPLRFLFHFIQETNASNYFVKKVSYKYNTL